jgi:hypothetical protein
MPIYNRLTDRTFAPSVSLDDLIHIVITGDTSQSPEGSSYKTTLQDVANLIAPSGAQGAQGATGAQGAQGASGVGSQGAQGAQGASGTSGTSGSSGTSGISGAQGNVGPSGAQGAQGATGSGAQGAQGDIGPTGAQGNTGAQGAQGPAGTGAQGAQGDTGSQGAQGAQGDTGAQGATGSGAQGAQGDTGSQGAQGAQGDTGAQGAQGDTGAQGAQGDTGAQGAQGDTGAQGAQGLSGTSGSSGSSGTSGTSGFGSSGTSGSSGSSGTSGTSSQDASKVLTETKGDNTTFYLTFVDSDNSPAAFESFYTDGGLSYNPSTNILDITGRIENGDGAAATPSYSFINDTNTGVYRITGDTLGFASNSNRRMSVGTNIVNLGAGGNGSLNYDLEGGTTTLNATPATLLTINTSPGFYTVEGWVIAGTATNTIGGKSYAVFKNVAGTLTQVGSTDNTFQRLDFGGGLPPSFTIDASGTTIRLRVTGQIGQTITWYGKFVYQIYDPSS